MKRCPPLAAALVGLTLLAPLAGLAHAVTLVNDGEPASVIVTRNRPIAVQQKAAEELQSHLEAMTGATVPIVTEAEMTEADTPEANRPEREPARIYVGQSESLKALGIDTTTFEPETLLVRTLDDENALVLAGRDGGDSDEPFYGDLQTGTLYAVYDFLQDELGCRWVWAGPTGRVVPERSTVAVNDLDIKETPELIRRHFRAGVRPYARQFGRAHYPRYMKSTLDDFYKPLMLDERHWLKRMRMGESDKPHYGHAFTLWYDKYHDKHPEVFALQKDGTRGLPHDSYPKKFVKLCVTSDKLVDMLIEQFKQKREKYPGYRWLNAVENDGSLGFCRCADCRALDVTLTPEVRARLKARGWNDEQIEKEFATEGDELPHSMSQRYFHFYNKLARRLAEVAPDAYVVTYSYAQYQYAPIDMKLEPNILIGLIGFNRYPMTPGNHQRELNYLKAWKNSGVEAMFFRPNSFYFSIGHGVPWDATAQMAGDFDEMLDGGILATDFDRLNGHWSTAARTYYVLARQHWDTDKSVEALKREFAQAFGPAAEPIDQYYDHWQQVMHEAYTRPDIEEIAVRADSYGGRIGRRKALPLLLTEQDFDRGRALLAEARSAAKQVDDAALLERIRVLEIGLEHGWLMREGAKFAIDRSYIQPTRFEGHWATVKRAFELREKLASLRAHNVFWLSNFELVMHDAYGMRVFYDFHNRDYKPVMTPTRRDWKFIPDPEGVGEQKEWFARRLTEGKALHAMEYPSYRHLFYSTWDNYSPTRGWKRSTGHDAIVNGWYQIEFAIPKRDIEAGHVLYVPYIKGDARIWVNDQLVRDVSAKAGASDAPITFTPDEAGIEADKPFRLTIKVHSPDAPGGLIGPVYVAEKTAD